MIHLNDDTLILVSAHNEEENILSTINGLKKLFKYILVVDDGSTDNTQSVREREECFYIKHLFNAGQGAAIQTGLDFFCKRPEFKYVITFDGDGQHQAEDALQMREKIEINNSDMIIGSRFLLNESMIEIPKSKKLALKIARIIENAITGMNNTDAHVGLRILNRKAAGTIKIKNFGMSHSTDIILQLKREDCKIEEMPVNIKYNTYGQSPLNGITVLIDLALNYIYIRPKK